MSRNAMLAKIHIAKKDLGLDDDMYRDLLEQLTGKRSASRLNDTQLSNVLTAFKAQGWKAKKKHRFKRTGDPQHRMIFALWSQLHEAGAIRDGSREALNSFVKRMTGTDQLSWVRDAGELNMVIEALKGMCHRYKIPVGQ